MHKHLTMTIGLPFSGKSALATKYRQQGYDIIERDPILASILTSSEYQQRLVHLIEEKPEMDQKELFNIKNELAIEMLNAKVRELVLNSKTNNIFYDGTNLQRKSRAGIVDLKNDGVVVDAIYLNTPLTEILKRAEKIYATGERSGEFNEQAILALRKMISLMEEPSLSEGFSDLKTLHNEHREMPREIMRAK